MAVGSNIGVVHRQQQGTGKATVLGPNRGVETLERMGLMQMQMDARKKAAANKLKQEQTNAVLERVSKWKLDGKTRWSPKLSELAQTKVYDFMMEKYSDDGLLSTADDIELMKRQNVIAAMDKKLSVIETEANKKMEWATKNAEQLDPKSIEAFVDYVSEDKFDELLSTGLKNAPTIKFRDPAGAMWGTVNDMFSTVEPGDFKNERQVANYVQNFLNDPSNFDRIQTLTSAYYQAVESDPTNPQFQNLNDWIAKHTHHIWDETVAGKEYDVEKFFNTFDDNVKNSLISKQTNSDGTSKESFNESAARSYIESNLMAVPGGWKSLGYLNHEQAASDLLERARALNATDVNYEQSESGRKKKEEEEFEVSKGHFVNDIYGNTKQQTHAFGVMAGQDAGDIDEAWKGYSMASIVGRGDGTLENPEQRYIDIEVERSYQPGSTEKLLQGLNASDGIGDKRIVGNTIKGTIRLELNPETRKRLATYYNRYKASKGENYSKYNTANYYDGIDDATMNASKSNFYDSLNK